MKRALVSVLALMATASSASVDNAYAGGSIKDAPFAQPFSWRGHYIGIHGGYARGNSRTEGTSGPFPFDDGDGVGYSISTGNKGAFGGATVGFNLQSGTLVYGAELDVGSLGVDGRKIINPSAPVGLTDTGIVTDYGAYGVLALRLGLAFDRTLFYAKGGVAVAKIKHTAGDIDGGDTFDPNSTTSFSATRTGYAIGGGVEYAFRNNWTMKAEYLYMDFGSKNSVDPSGNGYKSTFDLQTVKLGLNYKF